MRDGTVIQGPALNDVADIVEILGTGQVHIPGDNWLLTAEFDRQDSDLLLTGKDGTRILIRDYFNQEHPPDLITAGGGVVTAELVLRLAGPVTPFQFAQAETNGVAQELIGNVETLTGSAIATRASGVVEMLDQNSPIYQGDVLETLDDAAIGIIFSDGTTFSLGENGRMVIDEMVYDRTTQTGVFSMNMVQGVFSIISGDIAKSGLDAMTLTTPVATIGIRGTKVAGRIAQEGFENVISLLPEIGADGTVFVGELVISNQAGVVTLNQVGATVQMTSAFSPPPQPNIFSPQQIQQTYGAALEVLPDTQDSPGDDLNDIQKNDTSLNVEQIFSEFSQISDFTEGHTLAPSLFQLPPLQLVSLVSKTALRIDDDIKSLAQFGRQYIYGTEGDDVLVGGNTSDWIYGFGGDDVLIGLLHDDQIQGGPGNDTIDGGAGWDVAAYLDDTSGVSVNLNNGTSSSSYSGSDTLVNIEQVYGGSGNDSFTGSAASEAFSGNGGDDVAYGSAGNDSLDGGSGTDTLSYTNDTAGVTASLQTERASGSGIGSDTVQRFENLTGGAGNDTLSGNGNANVINGGDGDDTINGDSGNDTIDGGNGTDTLDLSSYTNTIAINLSANTSTGTGVGSDTLTSIENGTGGSGDDTLTGNASVNVFIGNDGDDRFVGSAGNDTLTGGAGTGDTVDYTAETTALTVSLLTGTATGSGIGTDTLSGIETVRAGSGNDTITTDGSANSVSGNDGDDTVIGSAGNDTFDGGDGTDTLSYTNDTAGVTTSLQTGTASGSGIGSDSLQNFENLTGGSGNDTLSGNGNANIINGGDGDDTINGDSGNDTIDGGNGTDTLNLSSYTNTIAINLSANTATGTGVGSDTLTSIENGTGGSGDDTLTGNASVNVFIGNDGDDRFVGSAGNDTLTGGAGTGDTVDYTAETTALTVSLLTGTATGSGIGTDTLSGIETVRAGSGNDTITTDGSANAVSGNNGDDTIIGSAGNDTIDGGGGTDTISYANDSSGVTINIQTGTASGSGIGSDSLQNFENLTGGSGNDTLSGNGNANVINGGDGDDTITGDNGDDTIDGGDGTDTLDLSSYTNIVAINLSLGTAQGTGVGTDSLSNIENGAGGSLGDTLTGDSNANVLTGHGGADTLVGNGGTDIFRYTATSDSTTAVRDTISDFDATNGAEDIWLDGLLTGVFAWLGAETNAFSGSGNTEARFNDTSKLLEFDTDGDATADMGIILTGVSLSDLDTTDFTLT